MIFNLRNMRDKSEDLPFEAMPKWAQEAYDNRGLDRSKYETFIWLSNPSVVRVVLESGVVIDFPETT